MLWMHIITWDPDKRDEVIKRAQAEAALKVPEGAKLIGFWNDLHGCRAFMLTDVAPAMVDAKFILEAGWPWHDLVKVECFPVMEFEEIMKLVPKV
jgi:hypothetical protein